MLIVQGEGLPPTMIRNAMWRVTQSDPAYSRKLERGVVIFLFSTPPNDRLTPVPGGCQSQHPQSRASPAARALNLLMSVAHDKAYTRC